jgi:hypothetical protein
MSDKFKTMYKYVCDSCGVWTIEESLTSNTRCYICGGCFRNVCEIINFDEPLDNNVQIVPKTPLHRVFTNAWNSMHLYDPSKYECIALLKQEGFIRFVVIIDTRQSGHESEFNDLQNVGWVPLPKFDYNIC